MGAQIVGERCSKQGNVGKRNWFDLAPLLVSTHNYLITGHCKVNSEMKYNEAEETRPGTKRAFVNCAPRGSSSSRATTAHMNTLSIPLS